MLLELLKAIMIGLLASAPIGPVSLLVMQHTFCHGRFAGFAAGVGSALIDTLYAVVSLFALMLVRDFIEGNEFWIMLAGGMLVCFLGWLMLRRKPLTEIKVADTSKTRAFRCAAEAAGCALANPGALAFMFGLMALFHLDIGKAVTPTWLLVLAVFAGALIWWLSFAFGADKLRSNFHVNTLNRINKLAGGAVIAFGLVLIVRAFIIL